MAKFKDLRGREWELVITIGDAKRLKRDQKIDLLRLEGKDSAYLKMVEDPPLFVAVMFCLLKPLADSKQVTEEDFESSLAGEQVDAAWEAFDEALVDFFPNPAMRRGMRKIIEKKKVMMSRAEAKAQVVMEQAMVKAETDIDAELETLGKQSTSSLVSPVLSPTP